MKKGKHTARAIIFNDEGKILMIERHKDGEHYFVLPGGHIEEGETPEQAAVREVLEETGLQVTVSKLLYTADDVMHNDQRLYLCNYLGGDPELQPDSQEYCVQQSGEPQAWLPAWFTLDELKGKTVYPNGLVRAIEGDRAVSYHHNPYKILAPRV